MGFLFAFWSTIIVYQIIELAEELDSQKSIKCSDDSSIISEEKNISMSVLTAAMTAFKIYGPLIGYRLSFHSSKCARNHYVIFIGT